ncbi:amidophosphoribosyltransferase [Lactobacillus sp. S2-2]|uniref:amidophosphoribosyltransferase n=1 Tax=Lactobacillus sp. S2-2 TaxID=2692917 RepID=UPI001F02BC5D|nr:amidophosphoribosyltransferase [Lactobacillus sp. S2-2]MCF6515048.1 amidophosphoribosyltransferase [Lactobacillus sp. S2-2]
MLDEVKGLNEECGIFGIFNSNEAAKLTYEGLHSLQHRGQEGAGIVSFDGDERHTYKGLGLLSSIFKDTTILDDLTGTSAIGHLRYATAGSHGLNNIQPFNFQLPNLDFSLAHNGNLTNAKTLKKELLNQNVEFVSDSDSEILGRLIEKSNENTFIEKIKSSLQKLRGGFAFILMTKDQMFAALDPNGFRPLVIGQKDDGSYVFCSETCALNQVHSTYIRDVEPGEIVYIENNQLKSCFYTAKTKLSVCSLEYVYFASSDSVIRGVSVHEARKEMGSNLAKEHPVNADVVLGVPNSSLSAALGYAKSSGIPYDMGMIKNQYIARTFIEPTQKKRERGVSMKLSVVRPVVEGKDVVLVDDSIVRGTTSRFIVKLLRDAGAKSIHVRIASPVLKYPCFYGVDIQTTNELIGANKTVDEIRQEIGADSLEYLSVDGLKQSINLNSDNEFSGLCTAYFDGKYPTKLYDYEAQLHQELEKINV